MAESAQGKSVKRIVQKVKQKHKQSDSIFGSSRLPIDTGKSLDKYLNSELIRRSQLSSKPLRQPNTDREDDIVIVGAEEAY
jgi:hypothetical protein